MITLRELVALLAIIAAIAANLVFQQSLADGLTQSWDQRRLHNPSAALIASEDGGRVTVYDGVMDADVERAMDEQFDRVGAMMFVRTQRVTETGDLVAANDCD